MKLLTCVLAAMTVTAWSAEQSGEEFFSKTIDQMTVRALNNMNAEQLATFIKSAEINKTEEGSPYARGFGAYKAKLDEWLGYANDLQTKRTSGEEAKLDEAEDDVLPLIIRPFAQKEVLDLFKLRENHLQSDENRDRLFAELGDHLSGSSYTEKERKITSYRTQPHTNAIVNRWINWLKSENAKKYVFDETLIVDLSASKVMNSENADAGEPTVSKKES
jgi:hypothetical protein